ncbi:8089_t:CDS:1, partial [Funneliformis caledonium]
GNGLMNIDKLPPMNLLSGPRVVYRVDSFDEHQILLGFAHITSSSGSCYDPPS